MAALFLVAAPAQAQTHTFTLTGPATVAEGETATFTVTRTGPAVTGAGFTIAVNYTAGTAANADFQQYRIGSGNPVSGSLSAGDNLFFLAGDASESEVTFTVTIAQDSTPEPGETFTLSIRKSGARDSEITIAPASATGLTVTILDDDTARALALTGPSAIAEGASATYTITLTGDSFYAAATINWAATGGIADITSATTGSVTFATSDAAGATKTFTINTADNAATDARRAFTLTLADPGIANTMVGAALTVSITDDEAQPAASPALHETMLPALTRAFAGRQFGAIARRAGAAGDGDGDGDGVAVWAGGDYRGIEGQDGDTEWDGDMLSFHLGVDGRVGDASRAGLMVSYSDSASDYSAVIDGQFQRGEYELDLTAVSPYWNWRLSDGGAAWASASVGSGEVEVTPDGEAATANDVNMTGVAAGGSWRLRRAGARELRVEADAFVAQTEVEGDDGGGIAEDLEVDANRLRVALALRAPRVLAGGAELTRTVDAGFRHDGGDGRGGAGMEVGGRLRFYDAARGLTVQGQARALLAHSGDQREWGVGGLLRLAPGADGQGFSLTLTPGYGDAEVDLRGLWDNGVVGFDAGAPAADPQARLTAEVGYGLPVAALASGRAFGFGDAGSFSRGMLTPYTALRLGDSRRDYRLGLRWSTGPRFALDLSARHLDAAATDNAVTLEGRLRF